MKSLEEVHSSMNVRNIASPWKRLLAFAGPAYLVSVGYMDPGNWATDIAGGSKFGYTLLWVLILSNLIAILVQTHSARLGVVTGRDLAQYCRMYYPRTLNFVFWILAELAIAACDLAEILGMAIGLNLLFGMDMMWGVLITLFDTFLIMMLMRRGMRRLEAFIIAMVSIIGISFLIELILAKPQMSQVITGFIPSIPNNEALYIAIGIIGATVMPHNLYLHSSLVQTRNFERNPVGMKRAIRYNTIDSVVALNLALFVNAAILIVASAAFHQTGNQHVTDITDAHKMLVPLLGTSMAAILFAVALIASGQSSTLTGTLTGQIIMEGYLNLRMAPWLRRIITRLVAIIPAIVVIWIYGEKSVGELLIFSQVILSLQLGFALIPLVHFVSSKKIMGEFRIALWSRIASWVAVAIIVSLNLKLVSDTIMMWLNTSTNDFWILMICMPVCAGALGLLLYAIFEPLFNRHKTPKHLDPPHAKLIESIRFEPVSFKKIALTLDFTEFDQRTISFALSQGGLTATYILIHIVESASSRMLADDTYDFETISDKTYLNKYKDLLQAQGIKTEEILGHGLAKDVLPKLVESSGADLLVMASHKHKYWDRLFKGRTIDIVQRRVNIPVLIIR